MRVIAAALLACLPLAALAAPTYGPRLEGFDYGYPVKTFALESQRQPLEMAYLDIAPKKAPSCSCCSRAWVLAASCANEYW